MMSEISSGFSAASSLRKNGITLFLLTLFCSAFFGSAAFAQRVPVKNVAVIETQIDERSGAASEIGNAEVSIITNEIRREAVNNLPRGRFNVMTSETVQSMGDAVLEECAEENCVIALGSKIGADYIVRGILSKFREIFTLTIEMYETEYGMLVATAAPVRTGNLHELLEKSTEVCAEMYKKFVESSLLQSGSGTVASVAPAKPESESVQGPAPAVASKPRKQPKAAKPMPPPSAPATTVDTLMQTRDKMASRLSEPEPFEEKKRTSPVMLTFRISTAAIAVGGLAGGIIFDRMAAADLDIYKDPKTSKEDVIIYRDKVEKNISNRNLLYILSGIGAGAFAVTLFF